jgi:hypothetical protein
MRRRAVLVAVAATGATACATVASADFVLPTPHEAGPNATIATDAVNDAINAVAKGDRRCQPQLVRRGAATTHDPPPQEMLDAFAVLRRPATAADAFDVKHRIPIAGQVAVDYIRRARVLPDGTSVYVVPALSARPALAKRPASCSAREREVLAHRLRGKPAPARREARRLLSLFETSQRRAASLPPQPGLFVFAFGPHGGGGGGGGSDVLEIRRHGALSASYVRGRGSRMIGLVPDGVATIDFTFARGHSLGLGPGPGHDRVYRTVYRRTAAVVDNVVYLTVPRLPGDALFSRQVWHAADGTVVNTIKPPFSRAG